MLPGLAGLPGLLGAALPASATLNSHLVGLAAMGMPLGGTATLGMSLTGMSHVCHILRTINMARMKINPLLKNAQESLKSRVNNL